MNSFRDMLPERLDLVDLTPGQLVARRGTVSCRPHHADWPEHNLRAICDLLASNPYVRQELRGDLEVSVHRSADMSTFVFVVSGKPRRG